MGWGRVSVQILPACSKRQLQQSCRQGKVPRLSPYFLLPSFAFCLILSPSVSCFLLLSLCLSHCLSLSLATKRQTTVGQKNLTTQNHRSAHDETFKPARTTGSRQLVCCLNPDSAGNIRNGDRKRGPQLMSLPSPRPCLFCLAEKRRVQLSHSGGKATDGTLPWRARCKAAFFGWSAAAAVCFSLRLCCICRNLQCQCNRHSALRNLPWCVQKHAPKSPRHINLQRTNSTNYLPHFAGGFRFVPSRKQCIRFE